MYGLSEIGHGGHGGGGHHGGGHHGGGGGGGWWGGYGPYSGYWPGYQAAPLYVASVPARTCTWYEDAKTDAAGSTVCQAPAVWLIVAGLGAAALILIGRGKR
jgi:hypothetical protein